jgi:hypothetical protein
MTILYLPTVVQLRKSGDDRFATSFFLNPPYVAW